VSTIKVTDTANSSGINSEWSPAACVNLPYPLLERCKGRKVNTHLGAAGISAGEPRPAPAAAMLR